MSSMTRNPASIPVELRDLAQWCLWKTVGRNGKPTKTPYQLDGQEAKSNDPPTWTTFERAWNTSQLDGYDGPGFVFQKGGGLVGIDLDGCRNPETGEIAPWAQEVLGALSSYSEVSPSGSGVKVFVRGQSPFPSGKNRKLDYPPMGGKPSAGIEVYDHGRYFAVTGLHLDGTPTTIEPRDLTWLRDEFWPTPKPAGNVASIPPSNGDGGLSVVERARRYVAKMPPAISGQNGHGQAFAVACALVKGFGLSSEEAYPVLCEYNARCEPPWSEAELRHKLEGAATAEGEVGRLRDAQPERSSGGNHQAEQRQPSTKSDSKRSHPPLTDSGNAERFARQHGRDIRYCHPWKKFLCWDGTRWATDQTGRPEHFAKQTARAILNEAATAPDSETRDTIIKWARRSESAAGRAAMLRLVQSEEGIPVLPDALDTDPWALNCINGTLDLRTGQLRHHRRENMLTALAPVVFDPDATAPTWERFLHEIFEGRDSLIDFVQRLMGYCLTGSVAEQILPIAHGTGANG